MFAFVHVSAHAVQRLRERFPQLAEPGVSDQQLRQLIGFEVQAAHEAGRVSTKKKQGFHASSPRGPKQIGMRFAWTACEQRGYVLIRRDGGVTVVTTLTTLADAELAAAA